MRREWLMAPSSSSCHPQEGKPTNFGLGTLGYEDDSSTDDIPKYVPLGAPLSFQPRPPLAIKKSFPSSECRRLSVPAIWSANGGQRGLARAGANPTSLKRETLEDLPCISKVNPHPPFQNKRPSSKAHLANQRVPARRKPLPTRWYLTTLLVSHRSGSRGLCSKSALLVSTGGLCYCGRPLPRGQAVTEQKTWRRGSDSP